MKNWKTLFVGAALLCACSDQETFIEPPVEDVQASFQTVIRGVTTRATDTSWESGDQIGIFAITHGEALSRASIHDGKANVPYRNDVAGTSAAFTAVAEHILFPGNGSYLDFVAYYPYTESVTADYLLPLDVSVQSPLSAIDALYATTTHQNKLTPSVQLVFKHQLSQVALSLTAEEGISLANAQVTIINAVIDGSLNLKDGSVTLGTEKEDIAPVIHINEPGNMLSATAILLPGQSTEDLSIQIQLMDGATYTWTPPADTLASNTKYRYALRLTPGDVTMIESGSSIEDWGEGPAVDPEDIEPDLPENKVKVDLAVSQFDAVGGTTLLTVTAPEGMEWSASTEESWLTLGDSRDDHLEVSIAPYLTESTRSGLIIVTVNGIPFPITITQEGAELASIPGMAVDLFISEYVDGGTQSESYIEIFNGTGSDVDLKSYRVSLYRDGNPSPSNSVTLSGTLPHNNVLVISHTDAKRYSGVLVKRAFFYFEGGTAIALEKKTEDDDNYEFIDIFGRVEDNIDEWTAENGNTTKGSTLRRKSTVTEGIGVNPPSGFPTLETEWEQFDQTDVSGLGKHTPSTNE